MTFFALLVVDAQAACPATSADLTVVIEDAESAFASMDLASFRAATDTSMTESACLTESVPRALAARLHRAVGLRAFVDGDLDRAARAFAAARGIEPAFVFPDALVPADHPVRAVYLARPAEGGATVALPPARGAYVDLDGRPAADRSTERPALAQLRREDGSVPMSAYLWQDQPMFLYEVGKAAPVARERHERRGPNVVLSIATGVALVGAGTTWAIAKSTRSEYDDLSTAPTELDALRARTNAFFVVSAGATTAAVGLGFGAVLAGHW